MQISRLQRHVAHRLAQVSIFLTTILIGVIGVSCAVTPIQSPDVTHQPEAPQPVVDASSDTTILPAEDPPRSLTFSPWSTDFSRRTIEWTEIRAGGPPKDGIPAIDTPEFESVDAASEWLSPRDPVIVFAVDDDVRAYPLAILMWHEIVNDRVGGKYVAVTFCPLCNASVVFESKFDDLVLDFGTTGLLRNSDLVMYDRQTETWWQQFTGEGLVGKYAGEQLNFLAAQVISFGDFGSQYPQAQVLARPSAGRAYGQNPYTNYDSTTDRPFLFDGQPDRRLGIMERIVGIFGESRARAYPFSTVSTARIINDTFNDRPIVVMHSPGTASALDSRIISDGRDVGSIGVFQRTVEGQVLSFVTIDNEIFDEETGTRWNHLGIALEGEMAGVQLERVIAFDHFWFAWAAFFPETEIYGQ